jgi:hypothetical protein
VSKSVRRPFDAWVDWTDGRSDSDALLWFNGPTLAARQSGFRVKET